jgi:hypothetical protein
MRPCIVLTLTIFAATSAGPAWAQTSPQPKRPTQLPESVRHIPPDATCFVHVRVPELGASELGKRFLRVEIFGDKETEEFAGKKLGIDAATVETITLIWMPTPVEWDKAEDILTLGQVLDAEMLSEVILVTTSKPFDRGKVVRALESKETVKALGENATALFLSDSTVFLGSKKNAARFAELQKRKETDLPKSEAIRLAAEKHHLVLGAHVSPAVRRMFKFSAELESLRDRLGGKEKKAEGKAINGTTFAPLLEMRSGAATIDIKKHVDLRVHVGGGTEKEVALAMQAAKTLVAFLDVRVEELQVAGTDAEKQFAPAVRAALKESRLEQKGESIEFRATLRGEPRVLQAILDYHEQLGAPKKDEQKKEMTRSIRQPR